MTAGRMPRAVRRPPAPARSNARSAGLRESTSGRSAASRGGAQRCSHTLYSAGGLSFDDPPTGGRRQDDLLACENPVRAARPAGLALEREAVGEPSSRTMIDRSVRVKPYVMSSSCRRRRDSRSSDARGSRIAWIMVKSAAFPPPGRSQRSLEEKVATARASVPAPRDVASGT